MYVSRYMYHYRAGVGADLVGSDTNQDSVSDLDRRLGLKTAVGAMS